MKLTVVAVLISIALAACASTTSPGRDDAGSAAGDEYAVDAGPIDGVLAVRVDERGPGPDGGTWQPTYILLDDGTRFLATPDQNGWVTFRDPTLKGPQTVSVMRVDQIPNSDGGVTYPARIETHLQVEKSVLDLSIRPYVRPPLPPKAGSVEVTLSSYGDGNVRIQVFGKELITWTVWSPNAAGPGGTSTAVMDLFTDDPGPYTVVAQNTRSDYDILLPPLKDPRAGMVSGVSLGPDGVARVNLALDQPFDQVATVTIESEPPGPPLVFASVTYWLGNAAALYAPSDDVVSPLEIRLPPPTGPFAALRTTLFYGWGETSYDSCCSKSGERFDGKSVVVPLPERPIIVAPQSGPHDDLRFAWTCPAGSGMSFLLYGQNMSWRVSGPCSAREFRPFPLPQSIPALRTIGPGEYTAELWSDDMPDGWVEGPDLRYWSGDIRRSVILQ